VADVKPIKTEADYAEALAELEGVWGSPAGSLGADKLNVLAILIDAWEAEHYPMDPPDPIDAINFRMEQQGLTRKDLGVLIGSRARIAEVLDRKRGLSIAMIRRLNEALGIPAEILIRPSKHKAT
jgi:HTH-type transcriptional regulator / antitoxin HigA